jgi:serine/threonine protein kinase
MRDLDGYKVRAADPDQELGYEQGLRQFMHAGNILHSFKIISNIARVYDVFEAYGTAYITENYIDGLPLSAILQQKRRFAFDEALDLVRPVMQALVRVHESGVMHRNINPSNIMVSDGEPCLIDFGIAGNIRNQTVLLKENQNKNGPGISCTRGYSAPEQMDDMAQEGAWTDVYGMAATLYRMVTGDEPDDAGPVWQRTFCLRPRILWQE